MSYVKVTNGTPAAYSLAQLRQDNPNVSFPKNPPDAILADYDVYPLVDGARPDNDVVEPGDIEQIDGVWMQTYIGRDYSDAEKRQDMIVTMRQARLALLAAGRLGDIEAAIAALSEPDKSQVSIEWEYASIVERNSPWVSTMAAALGMSDTDLDQLFISAAEL